MNNKKRQWNKINERDEIRLDELTTKDIYELYNSTPSIKISRDAFLAMTLCTPFQVQIPSLDLQNDKGMEILIEQYWMPWLRTVYDWMKMFQICPYYFERVKKTDHYYPVVPEFGSGYITTFINDKHKQEWKWYWSHGMQSGDDTSEEKTMHWIIGHDKPSIYGTYRSPISTLLGDYKTLRILRESLEVASTQGCRPPLIFEYHPPRNDNGDDGLTTLEAFGEQVARVMSAKREALHSQKMKIRKSELMSQLYSSYMHNHGFRQQLGTGNTMMWSDTSRDAWERNNTGLVDRSIPLEADYVYKAPAKPSVMADLEKHANRFDDIASGIMDFPSELMNPKTGSRASNVAGPLRFVNEKVKDFLGFFKVITKHAYLLSYGKALQTTLDGISRKIMVHRLRYKNRGGIVPAHEIVDLYASTEVHIHMSCTPLNSYDDLRRMWQDSLISKDDFAKHAASLNSIPIEEINIGLWPDKYPKEMLIKNYKDKKEEENKDLSEPAQIENK